MRFARRSKNVFNHMILLERFGIYLTLQKKHQNTDNHKYIPVLYGLAIFQIMSFNIFLQGRPIPRNSRKSLLEKEPMFI